MRSYGRTSGLYSEWVCRGTPCVTGVASREIKQHQQVGSQCRPTAGRLLGGEVIHPSRPGCPCQRPHAPCPSTCFPSAALVVKHLARGRVSVGGTTLPFPWQESDDNRDDDCIPHAIVCVLAPAGLEPEPFGMITPYAPTCSCVRQVVPIFCCTLLIVWCVFYVHDVSEVCCTPVFRYLVGIILTDIFILRLMVTVGIEPGPIWLVYWQPVTWRQK